jgi:hypothetical protein
MIKRIVIGLSSGEMSWTLQKDAIQGEAGCLYGLVSETGEFSRTMENRKKHRLGQLAGVGVLQ